MQENVLYIPKSLPVYGHFDVVVIGGGTAGAAAAISAAEEGLKTLVLERNGSMGGTISLILLVLIIASLALLRKVDPDNEGGGMW